MIWGEVMEPNSLREVILEPARELISVVNFRVDPVMAGSLRATI